MTARKQETMNIKIRGQQIEQVTEFKYLGVTIENNGSQGADIEERIEKTLKTYHAMRGSFIRKREISKDTKMTIYRTIYRSILTFGCESWVLNKRLESKLQALEMKYLRGVKGVTRMDKLRNADIREELGSEALLDFVKKRQLSWWGHLQRMQEGRQVKEIWRTRVIMRRDRGRPGESWDSAVAKILQRRGKTILEAEALATDRRQWAEFVQSK